MPYGSQGSGLTTAILRSVTPQAVLTHDSTVATETVINFGSVNNGVIDVVDGEIEILRDLSIIIAFIEVHITRSAGGGGDSGFSYWTEYSPDGINWTVFPESLRTEVIDKDGTSNIVTDLSITTPTAKGTYFRMICANTGVGTLTVEPPPVITTANSGATGYAKKFTIRAG